MQHAHFSRGLTHYVVSYSPLLLVDPAVADGRTAVFPESLTASEEIKRF